MLATVKNLTTNCSCGKPHKLSTDVIVSGNSATKKLIDYIKSNFSDNPLVVCDENTHRYTLPIVDMLGAYIFVHSGNAHANEIETARLSTYIKSLPQTPSVIIACGSGSIHDISRYCAYELHIPFVSYPTAASVDGFVSGVAAMTMYGQKLTYPSASPVALFADPKVYTKAPMRLTASGVGDMIGKITALFDWQIANLLLGEELCPEIYALMKNALDVIMSAVTVDGANSPAFAEKVMNGLILSGLAMQLQGNSRPASGSEHHMSHLWEMHVINDETDALHGEKVGVGTIYILDYLKKSRNVIDGGLHIDVSRVFDKTSMAEVFGNLADGILSENLPNGSSSSSALAKLDVCAWGENAEKIKNMIDELPSAELVSSILTAANAPVKLDEIGVPDSADFVSKSLIYSPFVRNRLTLAKVLSAIKLSV